MAAAQSPNASAPAVLITRPEPGCAATGRRVAAMGWTPVLAPVLRIEMLQPDLPAPRAVAGILATSGNAVRALPAEWHARPLLAVGEATARRAAASGFARVESADGDADALARLAARRLDPAAGSILLASGEGQGFALADALAAGGFQVVRREVYAARPVPILPAAAREALDAAVLRACLFFSAATARVFVDLVQAARRCRTMADIDALAIGRPAAVALERLTWRAIRTAARPTQDDMLALLR